MAPALSSLRQSAMLTVAALTVAAALALSLPALPPIGTAFEQAVSAEAVLVAATRIAAPGPPFTPPHLAQVPRSMVKVPCLGSCASSGRASRLWAAWHSQGEAGPLRAQPLLRVLEPAASSAADVTAYDHSGRTPAEAAAARVQRAGKAGPAAHRRRRGGRARPRRRRPAHRAPRR
eukprot:scaffold82147_cov60-Phaeocystis_antarctica.AAC.1